MKPENRKVNPWRLLWQRERVGRRPQGQSSVFNCAPLQFIFGCDTWRPKAQSRKSSNRIPNPAICAFSVLWTVDFVGSRESRKKHNGIGRRKVQGSQFAIWDL